MNEKTHFGFKEVEVNKKADHVGEVFHSVAEEYDLMNDAMSFGMHRIWKKILIELSELSEGSMALDIASGTADIPKLINKKFKSVSVHVTDINESMLALGKDRAINENFFHNCNFALASGEDLPYQDKTFDLVTVGFGLRNFTDKRKGLEEMKRVLKSDGVLLVLEFFVCVSFDLILLRIDNNKNINIIKNTTNNLSKSGSFTTFKWYEYLNLFKYSSAVIFSSCLLFLI